MQDLLLSWLTNIPALAVPYALASLGLIVSERTGVLSLGAEGLMLVGALAGACGARLDLYSFQPAGERVHASVKRRNAALHADRHPWNVSH